MHDQIHSAFVDEIEKVAIRKAEIEAGRSISSKALAGRLARGGKGLVGREKKEVASLAGLTKGQLEAALERLPKVKFMQSAPLSRLLTKLRPLHRRGYAKGLSKRMGDPRAPVSGAETDILKFLRGKEGVKGAWSAAKAEKTLPEFLRGKNGKRKVVMGPKGK